MSQSIFSERKITWLWLAGIVGWMVVHAWVLFQYGWAWRPAITDSVINNSILFLFAFVIAIPVRYYLPAQNRYAYLIGLIVFAWIVSFLISRAIIMGVKPGNNADYRAFFSGTVPVRLAVSLLMLCSQLLVVVLYYTLQQHRSEAAHKQEIETLAREAELFHLKEQLHPHFLFNSLNSINALVGSQPAQARNMIQQLGDFLRGTLRKDHLQWQTFKEEVEHLQRYLSIEELRFGERLRVTWHVEEAAYEAKLPALILQPVLENAIKYGLYDVLNEVNITIDASVLNARLHVVVSNPFDEHTAAASKGTGFGLRSIERRMYLLFGQRSLLETHKEDGIFTTQLIIPQPNV